MHRQTTKQLKMSIECQVLPNILTYVRRESRLARTVRARLWCCVCVAMPNVLTPEQKARAAASKAKALAVKAAKMKSKQSSMLKFFSPMAGKSSVRVSEPTCVCPVSCTHTSRAI